MRRLVDDRTGYGVVLVLIGVTYMASVSFDQGWALYAVLLVQLVALRMVLLVSHARRSVRRVADLFLLVVGVAVLLPMVAGVEMDATSAFTRFVFLVSAVLYGIAPLSIIRDVVVRPTVDSQTLLAAIAAYLLLGMFFAFTYRFVGALQTGSFFGSDGAETGANYLFFSFITLSTTGYGDLVPARNPGQTLAVVEAVTGQLFLVIAIAKIVAEMGGSRLLRTATSKGATTDQEAEPDATPR